MKKFLLGCLVFVLLVVCDLVMVIFINSGEIVVIEIIVMVDIGIWGFDVDGMDVNYYLGDDFFCYVNGIWFDNIIILEDCFNYGMFIVFVIEVEQQVQEIILELVSVNVEVGLLQQQVGDLYVSWMDIDMLNVCGM